MAGTASSDTPRQEAASILLVDDDLQATRTLARSLERRSQAYRYYTAGSAEEALAAAQRIRPEAAIVDLSLDPAVGPESGLSLIDELQKKVAGIRVIVLTGLGGDEPGIKALERGAASFVQKPADAAHLFALIQDAVSYAALKRRYAELTQSSSEQMLRAVGLSSRNGLMREVIEAAAFAAANNQPVLITGETGTGKGVIAQAVHKASGRKSGPFIRFQPGIAGYELAASELFGHKRGAFTGAAEDRKGLIEEADSGTLFIDEAADLPKEVQLMLLDVLQEKMFRRLGSNKQQRSDFRLITATNKSIEQMLSAGGLRTDFYHRIAHFTIEVPPLRRRKEDIADLAAYFIEAAATREKLKVQGLSPEALKKLLKYSWPGNVRECQAVVEGGAYRAHYQGRRFVEAEDLRIRTQEKKGTAAAGQSFRERIQHFEEQLVLEALRENEDNQSQAAQSLELDRSSFRRILKRTGQG